MWVYVVYSTYYDLLLLVLGVELEWHPQLLQSEYVSLSLYYVEVCVCVCVCVCV